MCAPCMVWFGSLYHDSDPVSFYPDSRSDFDHLTLTLDLSWAPQSPGLSMLTIIGPCGPQNCLPTP
jgi:hypothetical protein